MKSPLSPEAWRAAVPPRVIRVAFAAAVVWATVMGASDALAQIGGQTLTWVGGNTPNWSIRQNWNPAEIPTRGADLIFPASSFFLTTINDLVDLSVDSVTIQGGYTISGLALEVTGDPGLLVESPRSGHRWAGPQSQQGSDPRRQQPGDARAVGTYYCQELREAGCRHARAVRREPDITDLIGEDGCGVIRATNPLALGVSLVGRIQLGQNCTLRVEADTTLDKPIIVNGLGAPGTAGALVITAGVTLTERLELRVDSPAKIAVLGLATLDLPQSQVGLTMSLNSPLTVDVAKLELSGSAD